jgi:hypothetical protein
MAVCYPLDMMRTRLAVDIGSASDREFMSAWHCCTTICRTAGLPALYAGAYSCLLLRFQHGPRIINSHLQQTYSPVS